MQTITNNSLNKRFLLLGLHYLQKIKGYSRFAKPVGKSYQYLNNLLLEIGLAKLMYNVKFSVFVIV